MAEVSYRLDDRPLAETFGVPLSSRVADLVEVAMEVYTADRLTPRRFRDPLGRGASRDLEPVIPVRDVDFWTGPEVAKALVSLLDWFTGDRWQPRFLPYEGLRKPSETQGNLFDSRPPGVRAVALASGGLDSVAGAILELDADPNGGLVLVSESGNTRMGATQRTIARELEARTKRARWLIVTANLRGAKRRPQDSLQRSRNFLFLSLAAAAAESADLDEVRVYENGVGSLNLPYAESQVGAHTSRGAHPLTMSRMAQLVRLVTGRDIRFALPFVFTTKAQMCADIPAQFLDLVPQTVSCDTGFSERQPAGVAGTRSHLCGACTSCLLRRQALLASGHDEIDSADSYRVDAFRSSEQPFALQMMLTQVANLQSALASSDPWSALVERFPAVIEARRGLRQLGHKDVEAQLIGLYRQYIAEWVRLPPAVTERYLDLGEAA
jgi:7-cyano-7-deazaguanine synthase in queuosine biosynthesis